MNQQLSDIEIQRDLSTLHGWQRRGNALVRTIEFPTFASGIDFVRRTAALADELDHHPDIDIRYTKVTLHLSSHDAGGISRMDFKLAGAIDELLKG